MFNIDEPQWYILRTQYKYEQVVEQGLKDLVANQHYEDRVFNVVVPREEKVKVTPSGKTKVVLEPRFPAYVFIKMKYDKEVAYAVRNSRGVMGFLQDARGLPLPMSPDDVKKSQLEEVKIEDLMFVVGDTINIIAGPFKDWQGEVVEIKPDDQKVKVNIQIFGSTTTMVLDFNQVEKI